MSVARPLFAQMVKPKASRKKDLRMLSWIEIDADALRHNYRQFCQMAGRERVAPVLKSNAYGHGLKEAYLALAPERPTWLCVNYLQEGTKLREMGFQGRLLVVGPAVRQELKQAAAIKAEIVIGNKEILDAWLAEDRPCPIHVKFDTGMSRQGFQPAQADWVASQLQKRANLVAGICTHFANVEDVTDQSYATQQLDHFSRSLAAFRQKGLAPMVHAAASASALIMDESRFDLVRVGISLYGMWPSSLTRVSFLQLEGKVIQLRPVLAWRTEVTTVKPVAAGQFIGYGCTFRAIRDMWIVVLPIGYYEGFPRLASESGSYVLIHGQRCPVVGRICMNMMMADVTHLAQVNVGDVATLIGPDGQDTVSAADIGGWAKTIHYEILTRLHPEIPRRMVETRMT